jgi:hypothetical protein
VVFVPFENVPLPVVLVVGGVVGVIGTLGDGDGDGVGADGGG